MESDPQGRQDLEKLDRRDLRLLAICAVVAVVSLFVGVRYFFKAFPEAQIEFKTTKETSLPTAQAFLDGLKLPTAGYRHASVFGFDDDAKTFLERELGAEESGKLLDGPVRMWRWQHRWFRPLQKEELQVDVTTKGEVAAFRHLLKEEEPGASLSAGEARKVAEVFLTDVMHRRLEDLAYIEGAVLKRPHRTDHNFTWTLKGLEVHGADYRIHVSVAGDRASEYDEELHLPDAYTEGYKKLRSKNMTAGIVDTDLFGHLFVAMMILLVVRLYRWDVKWIPAAVLGAITFVLSLLSELNTLPAELYSYDTTQSLPAFLLQTLFKTVVGSLSIGAFVLLIAASAEPLYRDRFPGRLSLASVVRPRALRMRETFLALAVGLTLTCFFFAYENVFYIIANKLGAWAPRDVAYSDVLSTAFPWVYVLFIGWLPAITEEFISRMFSIPFFERGGTLLRIPAALRLPLAMVVAATIWGFGHAAYPNQPWWIRGLEVGLAGMVFGLVLLRFGITAVVTCHFSVDALYTAFVMIRSGNPYYVVTGCLAAGAFAILFLVALGLYVTRGGFLPARTTNEQEGTAPPLPPLPVPDASFDPARDYRPLPAAVALLGVLLAAGLVAMIFLPVEEFGDWTDFKITKQRAEEAAETFLRSRSFDVSRYQTAVATLDRTDDAAAAYLLRHGGLEIARTVFRDRVPTPLWRVRYFIPEKQEEYWVSVDSVTGGVLGFSRTLPDDAAGTSLEAPAALAVATNFAREMGQDPARGELKEQTQKDEKARRDHTLVWEYPIEGGGEAKVRYEVVVQGDTIGSWTRGVKVPEEYERSRTGLSVGPVAHIVIAVLLASGLAALAIFLFVRLLRAGEIPWRFALVSGAIAGVASALGAALALEKAWASLQYQTSMASSLFLIILLVGVEAALVLIFLWVTLVLGIAGGLYPAVTRMFSARSRRAYARDALVAGLVGVGLLLALPVLRALIMTALPSGRLITGVDVPPSLDSRVPYLDVLFAVVRRSGWLPAAGAVLLGVLARYFQSLPLRTALAIVAALALAPFGVREPMELLAAALVNVVIFVAVGLFIRFFLRNNPLAWFWSCWLATGLAAAIALMGLSAPLYRNSGYLALAFVLAPGLVLILDAMAGMRRREDAAPRAELP